MVPLAGRRSFRTPYDASSASLGGDADGAGSPARSSTAPVVSPTNPYAPTMKRELPHIEVKETLS